MKTVRHYHHNYHFNYETSLKRHLSSIGIVIVLLIIILLFSFHIISSGIPLVNINQQISVLDLFSASIASLYRLSFAFILALFSSIPLAIFITKTPKTEKFLLPLFDILQSIPVLAFFPVLVLLFIRISLYEGAAIFILFMAMLWNLVFSMIGGLKTIPQDILSAAFVFKYKGWNKLFYIILPAIFPYIITGSLLAWAQGWNILIVAEVLHNYIPNGSSSQDLFGLGSLLVQSSFQGNNSVFIASLIIMIILIGIMNYFIWQKLLHLAQRYKFD